MAFPFFQNLNLEKLKEAQGYVKGKPRVGLWRGGNAFEQKSRAPSIDGALLNNNP